MSLCEPILALCLSSQTDNYMLLRALLLAAFMRLRFVIVAAGRYFTALLLLLQLPMQQPWH